MLLIGNSLKLFTLYFRLRNIPLEDGEEDSFSIVMAAPTAGGDQNATENILSPALQVSSNAYKEINLSNK